MYQPVVNLTKPAGGFSYGVRERGRRLTGNSKDHPGSSYATGSFVPVIKHLEHGAHLFSTVIGVIFDNLQVEWRGAVDFDDAVAGIGCVGCDDVKTQPVLVQDELVEDRGSVVTVDRHCCGPETEDVGNTTSTDPIGKL